MDANIPVHADAPSDGVAEPQDDATAVMERELMQRAGNEDTQALDALYRTYGVRLCAYAWRWTRSRAIAEEIVQDVFLGIWTNRAQLDIGATVASYLFRSVRNRVLNHLRGERVRRRYAEQADAAGTLGEMSPAAPPADHAVVNGDLHDAVQTAIGALPPRMREIFLLNREQGLTYAQIAATLDISVKTVEYHMGRAFRLLRKQLAEWAVVSDWG